MATQNRILAIDDDHDILKLLGRYLGSKYILETATCGESALQYLTTHPLPDLILLDVQMPGMNGIELKAKLDQDERFRHIPVIYLTADTQNMDKLPRKFDFDFLNKPIAKEDLLDIVDTFFNFRPK